MNREEECELNNSNDIDALINVHALHFSFLVY